MNITELLSEAGMLMLAGMVVVFLFLSLLIIAINLLAKFAEAFPDKVTPTSAPKTPSTNSKQVSPQVVAAIGAAIKQYKARK